MTLKAVHERLEEIPEQYQDLYTEKDGKWELTGIAGVKTQADVDRLQTALTKERGKTAEVKAKLDAWSALGELEAVQGMLDRFPELEAASKGKLDESQIEEIVQRRVDGTIRSKLAPLERENLTLKTKNGELQESNTQWIERDRSRRIGDAVAKALADGKVLDEAREDALLLASRVFELREDDEAVVTRDGVGLTPGLDPRQWLEEIQSRKPHWWPPSQGGGARGSGGNGTGIGSNPWSDGAWNMTEQGRYVTTHGIEKAQAAAKAAGTTVGGPRPQKKG